MTQLNETPTKTCIMWFHSELGDITPKDLSGMMYPLADGEKLKDKILSEKSLSFSVVLNRGMFSGNSKQTHAFSGLQAISIQETGVLCPRWELADIEYV